MSKSVTFVEVSITCSKVISERVIGVISWVGTNDVGLKFRRECVFFIVLEEVVSFTGFRPESSIASSQSVDGECSSGIGIQTAVIRTQFCSCWCDNIAVFIQNVV